MEFNGSRSHGWQRVTDAPRIECRQLSWSPDDVTRSIQCDVTAKPEVVNMFWIIDDNGTTIRDANDTGRIATSSAVCRTLLPCCTLTIIYANCMQTQKS